MLERYTASDLTLHRVMQLPVESEFLSLCEQILAEGRTLAEWAEIESGDMFQSPRYCGGFETDEGAFTFSHYDEGGREIWFTVTLTDVRSIVSGDLTTVEAREPP
jgi:hypothetical protein